MEKENNKNLKRYIIIGLVILLIGVGITIAYFSYTRTSSAKTITNGTLSLVYENESTLNLTNAIPLYEDEVESQASSISFRVRNNGNLTAYATISLTDISMSSSLKTEDFVYELYNSDTNELVARGNFANASTDLSMIKGISFEPSVYTNYTLYIYVKETDTDQSSVNNASFTGKVTVEGLQYPYANSPELVEGLIPVIYNESTDNWKIADPYSMWYDYDSQMWANAVTVNDESLRDYTSHIDEDIPMDKIDTMWVWIPRYKYKITSNIGSTSNVTNPPQIDVVFESGTETTGTELSSCSISSTNCYYTHPAFRDGAKEELVTSTQASNGTHTGWSNELTGFWVGKFETGVATNSTCGNSPSSTNCTYANVYNTSTGAKPLIKPDVISLNYQNVSTEFQTSLVFAGGTMDTSTGVVTYGTNQYGITRNSTTDSHMVKNTEWGAVAYLSQSKYGKNGNSNYSGTNKEIYKNNSYASHKTYTGRSSGVPPASGYSQYGTYGYNDKSCSSTSSGVCTGSKTALAGTGASTTGTIYGIYDMVGGMHEYTMSNWAGTVSSSGFNSAVLTSTNSSVKRYYDKYTGTSSETASSATSIKGDATLETQKWYSDGAYFVYANYLWAYRGGYSYNTSVAGVFYFSHDSGGADSVIGFRSALIP